jgi:hypothetical protein
MLLLFFVFLALKKERETRSERQEEDVVGC